VHYAVRLLAGVSLGARIARARQSAAAAELLADLRRRAHLAAGRASKAHSRALAAAAVSQGRVGVDIEYLAPERDICAIARHLMDAPAPGPGGAYRVFTFREAYFKALGSMPDRSLLRLVGDVEAARFEIPGGLAVLHEPVGEVFVLTLVWEGGGASVRHELPDEAERRFEHQPGVHP
jgi:hypothetical protein